MNDIFLKIKQKYQTGSVVEKLIFINIAVFVLTYLLGSLGWLFGFHENILQKWFALPATFSALLLKPWTIITYGFMHHGFVHLLFNMIFLHYIGNLFLGYFIPKKLLTFYLMGTVFGGLLFVFSYTYFPTLQQINASLVGASSAVMAILIGITTYMPNYELKLRFIGFVKIWIIAAIFIVLDIIQLPNGNAGGHLAHIGGALYGFFAIYYQNSFTFSVPSTNILKKKSPLKTTYKSTQQKNTTKPTMDVQQKINIILEKISKSGYESLSKKEKEFLFKQGKNN